VARAALGTGPGRRHHLQSYLTKSRTIEPSIVFRPLDKDGLDRIHHKIFQLFIIVSFITNDVIVILILPNPHSALSSHVARAALDTGASGTRTFARHCSISGCDLFGRITFDAMKYFGKRVV